MKKKIFCLKYPYVTAKWHTSYPPLESSKYKEVVNGHCSDQGEPESKLTAMCVLMSQSAELNS